MYICLSNCVHYRPAISQDKLCNFDKSQALADLNYGRPGTISITRGRVDTGIYMCLGSILLIVDNFTARYDLLMVARCR